MKKIVLATMLVSSLSMADFIGGEVNLGYYTHNPSGTAQYDGDSIDIEDDLKWENEQDIFLKVYLEHPIPVIPNIKVGYTDFSHSGDGTPSTSFTFGGENYTTSANITSDFNLKMYDITLYYELLDNWLNLDAGINVKYIDGDISVDGRDSTGKPIHESTDFELPIPMLYAKAKIDIPTTDLSFQAEGNYVNYDGNTLYDLEAGVRYLFALGFGVEAGYKTLKIKIDDVDDFSMDTDFNGFYGKVVWDF
ncbi:MAG: TIGR04219 family outer membrane beta-barrel protein [Epsilonproteobacteria bacterium]|nr:TIGR04219 family outer membrane beta-barrel protein [Campylobacterota bacterium]